MTRRKLFLYFFLCLVICRSVFSEELDAVFKDLVSGNDRSEGAAIRSLKEKGPPAIEFLISKYLQVACIVDENMGGGKGGPPDEDKVKALGERFDIDVQRLEQASGSIEKAFIEIGEPAISLLIESADYSYQTGICGNFLMTYNYWSLPRLLIKMGSSCFPSVLSSLTAVLGSGHPDEQKLAVILAYLEEYCEGKDAVVEPILKMMRENRGWSDVNIFTHMERILEKTGPSVVDRIERILAERKDYPNENFNYRIADILGRTGDARADAILMALVKDDDALMRETAIRALVTRGNQFVREIVASGIQKMDHAIIKGSFAYLIENYDDETERLLIKVLDDSNDIGFAANLLNSNIGALSSEARRWAKEKGYSIEWRPF